MRFTTLAMIAGAMLLSIHAAPLSVRHGGGTDSSVSLDGSGMSTGDNNASGSIGANAGQQGSGHDSGDGSFSASGGNGQVSTGVNAGQDVSSATGGIGKDNQGSSSSAHQHSAGGKESQQADTSSSSGANSEAQTGLGLGLGSGKSGQGSGNAGLGLGVSGKSGASGKSGQAGGESGPSGSGLLGLGGSAGSSNNKGGNNNSLLSSLLPGLSDVTSVLDLNSVLTIVQGLPTKVQSQLLDVINQPGALTQLIGSLPANLQTAQLTGLPSKVQQLPNGLPAQLADLPNLLSSLPANLQALVGQLPTVLQAKVAALPSLIQTLPAQIDALTSASLQSKLQGVPALLIAALNDCQFDDILKTLDTLLGGGAGDLPAQLEQQLTLIQTTLTQITGSIKTKTESSSSSDKGGSVDTVTTLTGTVVSVDSITIMVVAELKAVTGEKVTSLQDKVSIPLQFCKDQVSGGGNADKGDKQISVAALLTVTGVQVSALTDKVALPLALADTLKSL